MNIFIYKMHQPRTKSNPPKISWKICLHIIIIWIFDIAKLENISNYQWLQRKGEKEREKGNCFSKEQRMGGIGFVNIFYFRRVVYIYVCIPEVEILWRFY